MAQYWFKPKRYGYGATPITWQGWLATTAFAVALVIASLTLVQSMEWARTGELASWIVLACFALQAVILMGFIRFAKAKTAAEWKWRWGEKE